jgi:Domain of unknown function (DUF4189)
MAMRMRHDLFSRVLKLSLFVLAINILVASSDGQEDTPTPGMENACVANLGYLACEGGAPGAGVASRAYWAAIAISPLSLTVGGAHGRGSESEAQETALQNCRRNGANDCKVVTGGVNQCVAMAISYSDKSYGYDGGFNRVAAALNALSRCRKAGGKNCVLIVAPCGDDDVRWSSPLPLPQGVTGGKVDPALVGTWIMDRNPGQWVWRVAANGTYEFHSEAPDNTPSNNGTLTARRGHYTLHAISLTWDDVGTYVLQSRDVVLATGKLGSGTWKRAN